MARVHVEPESEDDQTEEEPEPRRRRTSNTADVEIEREKTLRLLIDAITRVVVIVLYMGFTLVRERDAGLVVLDPDDDTGPEDDWAEA